MAFMGETADVGVGELLSVLARRGNTGRLHINTDGEEVQVVLNGGKVTQVSSSHHSLRIGRVLVRMGVLSDEDLNAAVKEQIEQSTAQPLGQILTSRGFATQDDLARAAEEQATDALSRVFGAQVGTFFFTGIENEYRRPGLMALNAEGIVLEASRRADEIEALRRMFPADDVELVLNRAAIPLGTQLPEYEQRVIRLLGTGPLTVSKLAQHLGDDERAVLRAIVGLHERGIVEFGDMPSADVAEAHEEAVIIPRRASDLKQLIGSGGGDSQVAVPSIGEIRAASPAGAQTVARATRVARNVVGAFNAGLPLLAYAHFTDDYFRRLTGIDDSELEHMDWLGEPIPEEETQTFIELRDLRSLSDGRVSGIVVTSLPNGKTSQKVVIFAEAADRYLIDAIVEPSTKRERSTQTMLLQPSDAQGSDKHLLRRSL